MIDEPVTRASLESDAPEGLYRVKDWDGPSPDQVYDITRDLFQPPGHVLARVRGALGPRPPGVEEARTRPDGRLVIYQWVPA